MAIPDYSASVARLASDLDQWSPNCALRLENKRLREALRDFLENPAFQIAIGGNPTAVDAMLARARAALSEQEGK